MEEKKMPAMRELSLDEMAKVSGGVDSGLICLEGISDDGPIALNVPLQEKKISDIVMGHRADGSYFLEPSVDERPRPNLDPLVKVGIGQ